MQLFALQAFKASFQHAQSNHINLEKLAYSFPWNEWTTLGFPTICKMHGYSTKALKWFVISFYLKSFKQIKSLSVLLGARGLPIQTGASANRFSRMEVLIAGTKD